MDQVPEIDMAVDSGDDWQMVDSKNEQPQQQQQQQQQQQNLGGNKPTAPSNGSPAATETTNTPEARESNTPLANEYDAMMDKYMRPLDDLEIESEGYATWNIDSWDGFTKKREYGPDFEVGGLPWHIAIYPFGNNTPYHTSLYIGRSDVDSLEKGWSLLAQICICVWNPLHPGTYKAKWAYVRYTEEAREDWGFAQFIETKRIFSPIGKENSRAAGNSINSISGTAKSGENTFIGPHSLVEDGALNITAYVRLYKDPTGVHWIQEGDPYDPKTVTGMIGLQNQGATCYLNSLLQSLFFTNAFRRAVYQIPTDEESTRSNSAWALQRLFYLLGTSETTVQTSELTQSFGWETRHIFEQQDVQELSRILMDRLEERMKGTPAENALADMFVGKTKTYISCINVDYESSRIEDYWDVQLNVRRNKNLDESFKDYIQVETMDGENKYFAEGYGLQDAKKGVIFNSFPTVLHLQLMRFEYDFNTDAMMKLNNRYEYPEVFDASPYLSEDADKSEPWTYQLHGILIHSGAINGGHYYAYIKPHKDGPFYIFNDAWVAPVRLQDAMEDSFGGPQDPYKNTPGMPEPRMREKRGPTNAYMLVYIRQSRVDQILGKVSEAETPPHIASQLAEEAVRKERLRKDREEAHLYLTAAVVSDKSFNQYEGFDLGTWDLDPDSPAAASHYKMLKSCTVDDFCTQLADEHGLQREQVRLWIMVNRENHTVRPDHPLVDETITLDQAYTHANTRRPFRLWLEISDLDAEGRPTWAGALAATGMHQSLILLKHFDVDRQTLQGIGHVYISPQDHVKDLKPVIGKLMGYSDKVTSELLLFEEIKRTMIEPMDVRLTFKQAEIQDGDIITFQKPSADNSRSTPARVGAWPNAKAYYEYLHNRIMVTLYPRFPGTVYPEDLEKEKFTLELSRKMNYDDLSIKVGDQLDVDPTHIRFCTVKGATGVPRAYVKRSPPSVPLGIGQGGQLVQAILEPQALGVTQRNDALFYEVLEISLQELESKKEINLVFLSDGLTQEREIKLFVAKTGTFRDLIHELKKKEGLDDALAEKVRIYSVNAHRIVREFATDVPIAELERGRVATMIAEVEPEAVLESRAEAEVKGVKGREFSCFHFQGESADTFGRPFKVWVGKGETLEQVKEKRIAPWLGFGKQDERFNGIKCALISRLPYSTPSYLKDTDVISDLADGDHLLALDHSDPEATGITSKVWSRKATGRSEALYMQKW